MKDNKLRFIIAVGIIIFLTLMHYGNVDAYTTSLSGSTGGVSYTAYKTVLLLPGGYYGQVESTAVSSMGRIGISYWTFDQKCNNGQWSFYYTPGGLVNLNSTYFMRDMFYSSSEGCYGKFGVSSTYTRSTGNHEFNMGTPVYRFLEAKL
ncbi:MAG: hypothetical protein CVU41_06535 [Chloroflexi bacterium HGW-Chloroflexi-3]|nr:MAG: hypothetical protein CVU41_06535 [Chloroflexi bacterium HGW-Chloroflexi-3]